MSSIREIAKRSGLSIATVSRHINKKGNVSEASARKIQAAIDEVNYVPNRHANALFTKRSGTIGLITPSIVNPYFSHWMATIDQKLGQKAFGIIVCNSEDDPKKELQALEMLHGFRVDGIIVGRSKIPEAYANIDIPVVAFENPVKGDSITVSADNFKGGRMAFEHLYRAGCRRVLHIKGPKGLKATDLRSQGFKEAAQDWNCHVDIIEAPFDYSPFKDLISSLEEIDFRKYDGVFVFNDIATTQLLRHLEQDGIKVPNDLKVIGFDNIYLDVLTRPKITTIEQPVEEIGSLCVDKLIERIEGNPFREKDVLVDVRVIQRESA